MPSKNFKRREIVCNHFGYKDVVYIFIDLYEKKKMSCQDVSNFIKKETGEVFSAQYIRNIVKMYGKIRTRAESYELLKFGSDNKRSLTAIRNDAPITLSKRFRVFQRNKFACPLCGSKENLRLCRINKEYKYGINNDFNLTIACPKCVEEKGLIQAEEDPKADEEVKKMNDRYIPTTNKTILTPPNIEHTTEQNVLNTPNIT